MKMKHVWNTIGIVLAIALVVGLAADGYADAKNKSRALMKAGMNKRTFSVTSQYLGSLEGDIYVGGKRVYVPSKTPVYVVGKGIQEDGYFANDQVVYVTGVHKHGMAVAKMIVVRPGETYRRPHGASSQVGEYADDVPN
jgi:hypothetical protein